MVKEDFANTSIEAQRKIKYEPCTILCSKRSAHAKCYVKKTLVCYRSKKAIVARALTLGNRSGKAVWGQITMTF